MNIIIRNAQKNDYNQVEAIMEQVQAMHTTWRPDIYKNVDVVLPFERYKDHVSKNELIVAATGEEKVATKRMYKKYGFTEKSIHMELLNPGR